MSGVLPAATTTNLVRTTVHQQYSGDHKAIGMFVYGMLIPIVFNIPQVGGTYKSSIIVLGNRYHDHSPYVDFGVRRLCCIQQITFNIQHYVKCYLPSAIQDNGTVSTPYTYNRCKKCGVTVKDSCGHMLQIVKRRQYNVNKYILRAGNVLQNPTGREDIFTFREGIC